MTEYVEVVVKIPKEEYEDIINSEDCGLHRLTRAVANGTLLPKGHGALKDTDAILRELFWVTSRPVKSQLYMITQAQTLVEADRE